MRPNKYNGKHTCSNCGKSKGSLEEACEDEAPTESIKQKLHSVG